MHQIRFRLGLDLRGPTSREGEGVEGKRGGERGKGKEPPPLQISGYATDPGTQP